MVCFKHGNIYYNYKDYFELYASPTEVTNDELRLQIIDKCNNVMIEKKFTIKDTDILPTGQYEIVLSTSEAELLEPENIYLYRLSYIDSDQHSNTVLSGNLVIEW